MIEIYDKKIFNFMLINHWKRSIFTLDKYEII